jgi:hypothetical protein
MVTVTRMAILTILVLGAAGVVPADACSCAGPLAPCSEYWRVSAVFAGTVRDIRPVAERPGVLAVRFDVDRRGRGIDSDSVVIESEPQNGMNCGYTFTVDQRYVVYARQAAGGPLATDMCSGTKRAADAAVDLAFLDEVKGPPRGVRVFGHVRRVEDDLLSFSRHDYGGVAGARVQLAGERVSREATTGADGNYDFRDLPPGTYGVTVTPPKGLALAGQRPPPWTVTMTNPWECGEIRTSSVTDSQISGVLLESDGRPAADMVIDLIAADNVTRRDNQIPHQSVRTGADGRFTFAFIAPGKYLVGLNVGTPPSPSQVDHRSYHPDVTDRSKATVVVIAPGSRIQLEPFRSREWPRERTISGVVAWKGDGPAPDARLTVMGPNGHLVPLDAAGRFSVTLPLGARFVLDAIASRIVNGKQVNAYASLLIREQDRDATITITLIPVFPVR